MNQVSLGFSDAYAAKYVMYSHYYMICDCAH